MSCLHKASTGPYGMVTNYGEGERGGGAKREGEGHVNVYPYEKRGGKSLSHAEGGGGGGAQKMLG